MNRHFAITLVLGILLAGYTPASDPVPAPQENDNTIAANPEKAAEQTQPAIPKAFEGDCPVDVSFEIADNIINFPEVHCSFTNRTDKEIAAIQLYFVPVDVYGEEVDNWVFTQNKLYTDNAIPAHGSASRSWQLIDQEVKSGKLYVYSVYFADGTEWGDRNATETNIKKHGQLVTME